MGFWSDVGSVATDVYEAVSGGVSEAVNVVEEIGNRVLGVPDFIASILGIRLPKRMQLRVVVLRDETSSPLLDEADAELAVSLAKDILKRQCQTVVRATGGRMIMTVDDAAPAAALDVGCQEDAWAEDFGAAGRYFRTHAAPGGFLGYGRPVTVFVVREVKGEGGCSLGPLVDYVTVDTTGMTKPNDSDVDITTETRPRTLAHEVAHACGLWHVDDNTNLMKAEGSGIGLDGWQESVVRNSRHVTYF